MLSLGRKLTGSVLPGPVSLGPLTSKRSDAVCTPGWMVRQIWTDPVAVALDSLVATPVSGPNTTTITINAGDAAADGALGADGVLDYARNLVVTVDHASSVVAMTGTHYGWDEYGNEVTEDFTITATGVQKTATGLKAFKKWQKTTITAVADASANDISIGHGKVFGLNFPLYHSGGRVLELASGSAVTNGTLVAASTTSTANPRGTYSPNGAPDGSADWELWYLCADPTTA